MAEIKIDSPNTTYHNDYIESRYTYQTTRVRCEAGNIIATPQSTEYTFRVKTQKPKLGVMLVGWGGNNGCTLTAAQLANKLGLSWHTKEGKQRSNWFGSITQASTMCLGTSEDGADVHVPFHNILPMVKPEDIVFGGWDISDLNLADAMQRAKVLDYNLQTQLRPMMQMMKPLPSIYYPDFIAGNQAARANNVLPDHDKWQHMQKIRQDIRDFKEQHGLDKVIVLWTANTEKFSKVCPNLNDTAQNLLNSIKRSEEEVSPSTLFAVASIMEGVCYINGSPQNTFVPGVLELAEQKRVFIAGDDFKSGQTKMKSVLVDFLVSAGIKPTSIVSYNHLGNNDGYNLSAPQQFRSKEISKSNVVDDMVASNHILYAPGEKPDHCVVIKYVPYVGDSKRAMDEYTSEIMMGGKSTIVMHNTCEDSLLAAPIILDLVILAEICQRISFKVEGEAHWQQFNSVLSILSYLCKAPLVPAGTPVVNALFRQKMCIENIFRACVGLPPLNHMALEHKHEHLKQMSSNSAISLMKAQRLAESQTNGHSTYITNGANGHSSDSDGPEL